jgi:phosphoglycolate phosphatase
MSINTILCDLDGTLVDSRCDISAAFQHAWQNVIGGTPPEAILIAQHIGKPLSEMVSELGGIISPSLTSTFIEAYRQMFRTRGALLTELYPEVSLTLQALSAFTLGIVTTKESGQAEIVLGRLALLPFFKHVQGSTYALRFKPAPDTILAALVALNRAPSQTLMVGDTPADILAGKAAGTMTCAVTYGFGAREELLRCAPDFIIDNFGKLLDLVQKFAD